MKTYILRGSIEEVNEEDIDTMVNVDLSDIAKDKIKSINLVEFFSNTSPHLAQIAIKYVKSLELGGPYPLSLNQSYFNRQLEQEAFWKNPMLSEIHERMFKNRPALIKSKMMFYFGNPALMHIIRPIIMSNDKWPPIFSSNPEGISLIEDELERDPESKKICWKHLMENPNAIPIIQEILHKNVDLFNTNSPKIYWDRLSKNVNAIPLVQIAIYGRNKYLNMDEFTKLNDEKVYKVFMDYNTIEKLSVFNYYRLLCNIQCVTAIDEIKSILYTKPKLVNWKSLSGNSSAGDIINENKNLINWSTFGRNLNIITSKLPGIMVMKSKKGGMQTIKNYRKDSLVRRSRKKY